VGLLVAVAMARARTLTRTYTLPRAVDSADCALRLRDVGTVAA
jgi:hypothetical protein